MGQPRASRTFVNSRSSSSDGYRYYQKLIAELDDEIARLMHTLPNATEHPSPIPNRTKRTAYQRMGNDPLFDLRSELYRIAGVDLTDTPGVSAIATQVVLTEVGPDVNRFRNASAFASWLGLYPDRRISGGKVLSTKTRKVKNRVAIVLRLGAKSLSRAEDYFGAFFRRMRARLGTLRRPLPQPRTSSHASSTTSYTAKNPTQRQSSTAAMNKNINEPKCAFANTPHNSASNSYPSQQIQQLRKLVPEESCFSESSGAPTPCRGTLRLRLTFEEAPRLLTRAGQKSAVCVRNLDEVRAEESIELPLAEVNGPSDQEQGKEQAEYTD
jgi:Transposase IS116/IS110/IS902 family